MVTYGKMANKLGQGGLLNLFAAQELKARDALSSEELNLDLTDHADGMVIFLLLTPGFSFTYYTKIFYQIFSLYL